MLAHCIDKDFFISIRQCVCGHGFRYTGMWRVWESLVFLILLSGTTTKTRLNESVSNDNLARSFAVNTNVGIGSEFLSS